MAYDKKLHFAAGLLIAISVGFFYYAAVRYSGSHLCRIHEGSKGLVLLPGI